MHCYSRSLEGHRRQCPTTLAKRGTSVVAALQDQPQAESRIVEVGQGVRHRFTVGEYRQMGHEELVLIAHQKDQKIERLQRELRLARQSLARTSSKLQTALTPSAPTGNDMLALDRIGKKHLSVKGILALGLRRNVANIPACHVGQSLMVDVTHPTVIKAELVTASAFKGSLRDFHSRMDQLAHDHAGILDTTPVVAHAFQSDATNSNCWHQSKLQALSLQSAYLLDPEQLRNHTFRDCVEVRQGWADTQRVTSSTAAGTHALIAKQLRSLGRKPWPNAERQGSQDQELGAEASDLRQRPKAIRLWLYSGDGGPDVAKVKKLLKVQTCDCTHDIFIATDCKLHSEELVVKSGLILVDRWLEKSGFDWRYFSACAKLTHVWRDSPRLIFKLWLLAFGPVSAMKFANKLPPKAISGRWGSIDNVETLIDSAGQEHIEPVFKAALLNKVREEELEADFKQPIADAAGTIDNIREESMADHRVRLGRWRRDVLNLVQKSMFFYVVHIARVSKGPLSHHRNFLQTRISADALEVIGNHNTQLICGKAASIYGEFSKLLEIHKWMTDVCRNISTTPARGPFSSDC